MDRAFWIAAFAKRIGEYSGAPSSEHVAGAEEHYDTQRLRDPLEAADEALRLWESEGAELKEHFASDEWKPGEI